MTTATHTAHIKDDYAQQIASDLSANQAAQEQTRTELQRLQEELSRLEDNEKVLLKMREALGIPSKSESAQVTKRGAKRTSVPAARSASPAGKKAVAAKSTAADKASRPRATAAKAESGKKDESGQTWLELVTAVIAGQTEPKSAAEVTDVVSATHPERNVQATVIRNALEQGVARGLLERSKQGRSVYYTPAVSASTDADTTSAPQS
ncbi:hypothetical protein ABZX75_28740 [Streptomyces sp. NPDC003038]|uniref:hypothetical protein n=1 Tax=unclassified Streptomyces TaxID=2593676 RepID=UPI0033B337C8